MEHTKVWLSFEEEMRVRGSKIAHKLLEMRIVPTEGNAAEHLALSERTPVLFLQRQRLVGGQAAGYEVRYLPRHSGEALMQDEIHNQPPVPAVERILERKRTRPALRVSACVVRREETKILEAKVGAPGCVDSHSSCGEAVAPLALPSTMAARRAWAMLRWVHRLEDAVTGICVAAFVTAPATQVLLRYIFTNPLPWPGELAKSGATPEGVVSKFSPDLAPYANQIAAIK